MPALHPDLLEPQNGVFAHIARQVTHVDVYRNDIAPAANLSILSPVT